MIDYVRILDSDEKHAPPALPVVNVCKVGSDFFFEIVQVKETGKERIDEIIATIAVPYEDLKAALSLLEFCEKRKDAVNPFRQD